MFVVCVSALSGSGWLSGCAAPPVEPSLQSDSAVEKVPALIDQADRGDDADFRALVGSLDDPDPAVRLYAIRALEELTGQTHGYRYYQRTAERRPAVEQWKAWLAEREPGPAGIRSGDGPLTTEIADGTSEPTDLPGPAPGVSP